MTQENRFQKPNRLKYMAFSAAMTLSAVGEKLSGQSSEMDSLQNVIELGKATDKDIEKYLTGTLDTYYANEIDGPEFERDRIGLAQGTDAEVAFIDSLMTRLSKAPEGKALIDSLEHWDAGLFLDSTLQQTQGYYMTADEPVIALNPDGAAARLVSTLAHEAAHARQDQNELLYKSNMSVEESLLLGRFVEADACAHAVLAAWQLKELDDTAIFEIYAASPTYGKMCQSVAELQAESDEPLTDKEVLQTAFEGWFINKDIAAHYDCVSVMGNAYQILKNTPEDVRADYTDVTDMNQYLKSLCITKEGECYLDYPKKFIDPVTTYARPVDNKVARHCLDYLSRRVDSVLKSDAEAQAEMPLQADIGVEEKEAKKERILTQKENYRQQKKAAKIFAASANRRERR